MFNQNRQSTSSNDSIYSTTHLFNIAIEKLRPLVSEFSKFRVIDFSAGNDMFCNLLRASFPTKVDKTESYDLVPTNPNVVKMDWFDVVPGYRSETPLIIGFNPPFGYRSEFARKFLLHASVFEPDIIISVVPRALREFEMDHYHTLDCELLDPFKSYHHKSGVYGTYLKTWKRVVGMTHKKTLKRRTNVKVPKGMQMITNHRDNVVEWKTANTLFVRRSGWNPGLKIVYCDEKLRLFMVDPNRVYSRIRTIDQIKNSIKVYNSYTITDFTLIRWKEDSIDNLLYSIWDRVKALNINRNESMMPYLDSNLIWSVIYPSIVIVDQHTPSKYQQRY